MKIASKIKPRSGKPRRVTVHGRLYVFAPTLDRNEELHFVAEVKNSTAAETLIASGHYYPFGADLEPVPLLTRTPAPAAPVPQPPAPPVEGAAVVDPKTDHGGKLAGTDPTSAWPPEVADAAMELLKGSAGEIATAVGKVPHADVVKAARDIEAKAEKSRKNVLQILDSTLQGIAAAGLASNP